MANSRLSSVLRNEWKINIKRRYNSLLMENRRLLNYSFVSLNFFPGSSIRLWASSLTKTGEAFQKLKIIIFRDENSFTSENFIKTTWKLPKKKKKKQDFWQSRRSSLFPSLTSFPPLLWLPSLFHFTPSPI